MLPPSSFIIDSNSQVTVQVFQESERHTSSNRREDIWVDLYCFVNYRPAGFLKDRLKKWFCFRNPYFKNSLYPRERIPSPTVSFSLTPITSPSIPLVPMTFVISVASPAGPFDDNLSIPTSTQEIVKKGLRNALNKSLEKNFGNLDDLNDSYIKDLSNSISSSTYYFVKLNPSSYSPLEKR